MSVILVTGASGFVGSRLIKRLATTNTVISLSRSPVAGDVVAIEGNFASRECLALLDRYNIDVAIHLGGVTGDASEEDAIAVNVAGTRRFLRYLIDRGTSRFVLASSIAAAGCLDACFMPRAVPIPDEHPCDSTNVYGVSKAMMEDLAAYFHRVDPALDFTIFRIGEVVPEDTPPVTVEMVESISLPFCNLGVIAVQDVAEAFALAANTNLGPGLRQMNLVAPMPRTPLGTIETLRLLLGNRVDRLDLSYYHQPGNENGGVYATSELRETLGYTPPTDVRSMTADNAHA